MDIFLEISGVVLLAVAYFVLQTYTAKKSRIPTTLKNPELVPIIAQNEEKITEKVSFEDLVGEMTDKESEENEFGEHIDTNETHVDEENFPHGNPNYLKLEQEVIRLKEIVENLDNEFHKKSAFSYKKMLQNPDSVRKAFIASEIFKPKFESEGH